MSHPVAAKVYPNNIFKQTTPDEEQALKDKPRFQTWYKGWLTRSEIYERKLPDGLTSALRIDGPSDSALSLDGRGNVRILTGKKNSEIAGSGVLGIKTWGQQQLHNERSNIQYCAGGTENEGQALNVLCYGDVVEQAIGSTRFILAQKIEITATEELVLNGQTIKLQADGDIQMAATSINTAQVNKKDIVLGQKMTFGVSEETSLSFDPRASVNIVSPGHINHKVLGDYQLTTGGVCNIIAGGAPLSVPMVKDRTNTLTTKALLGNLTVESFAGITQINSKLATNVNAGGAVSIVGVGAMTLTGATLAGTFGASQLTTAAFNITSAAVGMQATSLAVTASGNITLTGALIYLN